MLYRLVRPVRRKGSRVPYFVQRIPADVKPHVGGLRLTIPLGDTFQQVTLRAGANDIRFSLRTSDPSEAKVRHAAVAAHLEKVWRALREKMPVSLTHRQATALAGELYLAWAGGEDRTRTFAMEHDPATGKWTRADHTHDDEIAHWEAAIEHWEKLNAEDGRGDLEKPLGSLVDGLLLSRGIRRVDQASRAMLLTAFWQAMRDAFASRRRNAEGDYSPDPGANRFPEWEPPHAATTRTPPATAKVSLRGLVEAWWIEAKATSLKQSTYESYRNTVATFGNFLGHNDATRVTTEDVLAFKNYRLASTNARTGRPISPKTVKDSDLAGLKTIFGWALANRKIATNPAAGVTLKLRKRRKLRSSGFTDAEAISILTASLTRTP